MGGGMRRSTFDEELVACLVVEFRPFYGNGIQSTDNARDYECDCGTQDIVRRNSGHSGRARVRQQPLLVAVYLIRSPVIPGSKSCS